MNTPHAETPRAKPTVVDVAIAADVAVGTVSRVLNTPELVGADIRQRVLEAIERLEYRPLRRRRRRIERGRHRAAQRGNVGVIFLGVPENAVDMPVLAEAMRGMDRFVASRNENLMRTTIPAADKVPLFMTRNLVDGLILRAPVVGDWRLSASAEVIEIVERLPHVWLITRPTNALGDLVGPDVEAAAAMAVEYLVARGHRRGVFFDPTPARGGVLDTGQVLAGLAGKRGLTLDVQQAPSLGDVAWPIEVRATQEQVVPLVTHWTQLAPENRPSVVVVPGDDVAFQLYAAFHGRGVAIGRDVSVFSLRQERGLVAGLLPRLATIDIQAEEIGRRAIDQLRWRLEHPGDRPGTNLLIRPKLVEGDSVATLA